MTMIKKLWENDSFKVVVGVLGLAALVIAFSIAMRTDPGPHDLGEATVAERHEYVTTNQPFPYEEEEGHIRNYGPSDQPRPTAPPVPGWMHNEMVFVSEVQESEALRDAYTPNELLTFGIVTCRGDVDLRKAHLLTKDVRKINQSAQKYLCVLYR